MTPGPGWDRRTRVGWMRPMPSADKPDYPEEEETPIPMIPPKWNLPRGRWVTTSLNTNWFPDGCPTEPNDR